MGKVLRDTTQKRYAPVLEPVARRVGKVVSKPLDPPTTSTIEQLYEHYSKSNQRLSEIMDRPLPKSWHSP